MILPYCFIICNFVCICFFYSVCIIMTKSRKYIYFVISVIVKGNKQEKFSCIKHNHLVISVPLYHHSPHLLHVPVRLEDVSIDLQNSLMYMHHHTCLISVNLIVHPLLSMLCLPVEILTFLNPFGAFILIFT